MIHWNSFADFLAMGGYGGYVWGSFGLAALVLAGEPLLVARRGRGTIARLKRQMRAELRENPTSTPATTARTPAE